MTGRLIDADKVIGAICNLHINGKSAVLADNLVENSYAEHLRDAVREIQDAPTVDAIPLEWIEKEIEELEKIAKTCKLAGTEAWYTTRAMSLRTLVNKWKEQRKEE